MRWPPASVTSLPLVDLSDALLFVQIFNVCATLNEFPNIRYYAPETLNRPTLSPTPKQHLTRALANMVDAKLKEYARDNAEFQVSERLHTGIESSASADCHPSVAHGEQESRNPAHHRSKYGSCSTFLARIYLSGDV